MIAENKYTYKGRSIEKRMWKLKVGEGGRWLMSVNNHVGRQHWEFDPDAGTAEERAEVETLRHRFKSNRFVNKQSSDALMRMQMRKEKGQVGEPPIIPDAAADEEGAVTTTLVRGVEYWCSIQAHDGHWPSESAGPLFFFPPLIIALYIAGDLDSVLPSEHQKEIKRYIYNHQNEDGGWGLHIEGQSTMFGSTLNYVALRLIGEGPDDGEDNAVARGRKWILDHGGALGIPSWGKFWLSVLGVYDWAGCNPLSPEFWLLPSIFPIHPGKIFCYCRLVYMPMSYLYGRRFIGEMTPLVHQLREELYEKPIHQINWNLARNTFTQDDVYYQLPLVQVILWGFLYHVGEPILRSWPFSKLREKAMKVAMEHIHYEDINSRYITIGCVEKILCMIACWVEDPNSEAYKYHLARIPDYFWVAEDGMKMQSFGSQMWDTALSIQAILSSNLTQKHGKSLRNAHEFVKASQLRKNPSEKFKKMYRHTCKGAWTFSMQDHGWQVSDCTAEGLKVAMLLSQMPVEVVGEKIEREHLYDAVNVILTLQSENGGFPAWEPRRAYRWVEVFNPTNFFKDVLIETEYVECTSSVIQSLSLFKKLYSEHRRKEIETCIERAFEYIIREQNPDGSWIGCWGTCFTYGTWFAVDALSTYGKNYNNCFELRRACDFLISKQLQDGGWGESYLSSPNQAYTNLEGDRSNLVQTSWALLALIKAGQNTNDPTPIRKGIRLLINSQLKDGDFPQQETTGFFFKSCSLNYAAYRNIFPIWALGEYQRCLQRKLE